ncbi:MAG: VWA domain-containing protein [Bacteroidota bacterium]
MQKRWRLILGASSDPEASLSLSDEEEGMDEALEQLYEPERTGNLGSSSPGINRWLGDIRKYFPSSVIRVMQRDAIDRLGLDQMLLEPELLDAVEPDVNLVGTLLSLNKVMPSKTRETAKSVIRKVVDELIKKMASPLQQAISGSISRAVVNRRPKLNEIDWRRTITKNLKHYQPGLRTIIPENLVGFGRKGNALKDVILCVDQSGSMASSVVYASIFGAVMATIRSLKTHMIVFDTSVVDLTNQLNDPVELLFGTQLGGGTDINRALSYAQTLVKRPSDTIMILISDLFEGGNQEELLKRIADINSTGVQMIALLALDDEGVPSYDRGVAGFLGALDIPCFACTPDLFPEMMAAAIKKESWKQWMYRNEVFDKS